MCNVRVGWLQLILPAPCGRYSSVKMLETCPDSPQVPSLGLRSKIIELYIVVKVRVHGRCINNVSFIIHSKSFYLLDLGEGCQNYKINEKSKYILGVLSRIIEWETVQCGWCEIVSHTWLIISLPKINSCS